MSLSPTEINARRIFSYLSRRVLYEDRLMVPHMDNADKLMAHIDELNADMRIALHIGQNPTDDFDPLAVASIAARIASAAYALARNQGVLNAVDLEDVATRLNLV
jgi:hypothetical protein